MDKIDVAKQFIEYQQMIISCGVYAGMPDLQYPDGRIQWENPSNRSSGAFRFTHDRRLAWWKNKAAELGISTNESKWISKVAKFIHPTKKKPCKVCGRVMDIRYCYLNQHIIPRIRGLRFVGDDFNLDELTHVADFVEQFIKKYKNQALKSLPTIFKCKAVNNIPTNFTTAQEWIEWLWEEYIPKEPSLLSPGAMANPPDRLDGFHSFNRCCRSIKDKGRSKENLRSYTSDRRAFEFWSDGNWIQANMLMNLPDKLRDVECANARDGKVHPKPCSADHIGPISLGFCHRPTFQLLCTTCNSAKNNRMTLSDVQELIKAESTGEEVASWYAKHLWDLCKNMVNDNDDALRLSRMLRDNRHCAMRLLYNVLHNEHYLFLLSLLNLQYADNKYEIIEDTISCDNHFYTASFKSVPATSLYVFEQKARKVKVAFEELEKYASKEHRNGLEVKSRALDVSLAQALRLLDNFNKTHKRLNNQLVNIIKSEYSEERLKEFFKREKLSPIFSDSLTKDIQDTLSEAMRIIATEIASNWSSARYSRVLEN